jgi:hypothetical protein
MYTPKAQWLLYVPPGVGATFTNSTFCPHSVFMCFVWISEQTAIISLYSINSLVFITETESVYCAVRTGSLYIIQLHFTSSWFPPVSIIPPLLHTHSFTYHRRCIMFFSQYFSLPSQYHSTIAPYSFIHLPPTLYNVFLPVLQFLMSVSFHQYSVLIHSSNTDAV